MIENLTSNYLKINELLINLNNPSPLKVPFKMI